MRLRGTDGQSMVAMLIVMMILMGIGAAIHTAVMADTAMRGAQGSATAGFYAAEAGINRGIGDYRNIFLSYQVPSGADFNPHSFTLGPRTVRYQLASVPGNPTSVVVPAGKQFAGLSAIEYKYTANATSELRPGDTEASLGTEFDVDYVPLFQFLAFYAGDLEILPGSNMTLHGPIHTNGNLYLNASGVTLKIADLQPTIPSVHVSSAGDIYRRRKDDPTQCTGTVQIAKLVDANHDGALDLQTMTTCGLQSTATLSTWLGSIKSHQPTVSVPTPDVIARGTGTFWQNADLRIVLDLAAMDNPTHKFPIVAENVNGVTDPVQDPILQAFMAAKPGRVFYNDVPVPGNDDASACTSGDSYCNPASYTAPFGANPVYGCAGSDLGLYGACPPMPAELLSTGARVYRRGGFYNNREQKWVYMLNLNVYDLLNWNRGQIAANQFFPPGGSGANGGIVIFLTVVGPGSGGTPNPRYGVRILGSPRLTAPLTVVSDQAMYVEGDYNVGGGPDPKQGAAVMGDTINVLSNNWSGAVAANKNDAQSRLLLSSGNRAAASTTINAAFIGGVDVTTLGNYNGGLENYPRFHEDWGGRTLTYRGSFVSLGTPRHNNGSWCGTGNGCNIYNPPVRNWDYDTDFQAVNNLPPLTPRFVSVQQILFTENFR